MSNKFGLYVADASMDPNLSGYEQFEDKIWQRKKLVFNGNEINKSSFEVNKLGAYVANNKISLNGNKLASDIEANTKGIICEDGDLHIGDTQLTTDNTCINITAENYTKLRQGHTVDGYSQYNSKKVYYITDDVANEPIHEHPDLSENEDILYNNFELHSGVAGLPFEHSLTDKTFTDPLNTPEFVIRHFEAIIDQDGVLEFEYFVDTKNYDFIENGVLKKDGVYNTFTVCLTDEFGHEIFKRTTFGGEFKVKATDCFKDADGNLLPPGTETWFKARCVDNQGRGGVDYFYNVLIKPTQLDMYDMQESDISSFNITRGELTGTETQKYIAGRNNKKGLHELFWWAKNHNYGGVRLLNRGNAIYTFDSRSNAGTEKSPIPAYNEYFLVKVTDINITTEIVNDKEKVVGISFVMKSCDGSQVIVDTDGIVTGTPDKGNTLLYAKKVKNSNNEYVYVNRTLSEFIEYRSGLNGGHIVQNNTINGRTVDTDPYSWVRHDGSHIHRNGTTENALVQVMWRDAGEGEVWREKEDNTTNYLRVGNLQQLLYMVATYSSSKADSIYNWLHKGEGYYYVSWYMGSYKFQSDAIALEQFGLGNYPVPDDFVIDLNGATIKQVTDDIHRAWNHVFYLNANRNTHIKNGKIIGSYTRETIKDAYLKQAHRSGGVWEGADILTLAGSRYCSFENLEISNLTGYGIFLGWTDQREAQLVSLSRDYVFFGFKPNDSNIVGYINTEGNRVTKDSQSNPSPIIRYNNESLIKNDGLLYAYINKPNSDDKSEKYITKSDINSGAADICLMVSGINDANTPVYDYISVNGNKRFGRILIPENSNGANNNRGIFFKYKKRYNINDTTTGISNVENESFNYTKAPIVVHTTSKWLQGQCFPECFVVCYNSNNKVLDIIKTLPDTGFQVPVGTQYCRLVVYGIGKTVNGVFTPYSVAHYIKDDTQLPKTVVSTFNIKMHREMGTNSFTMKNCTISNTRSLACGNPGINHYVEGCTFSSICATDSAFNLTPMLYDAEESAGFFHNTTFKNSKVDKGFTDAGYNAEQSVLGFLVMRNCTIDNCRGIGVTAPTINCYFKDTAFSLFKIHYSGNSYQKYKAIVRRCSVRSGCEAYCKEGGGSQLSEHILQDRFCWEKVATSISAEDVYLDRYPAATSSNNIFANERILGIIGRVNKFGNVILGEEGQVPLMIELLKQYKPLFHEEDVFLDNNNNRSITYRGWMHMLVRTSDIDKVLTRVYWQGVSSSTKTHTTTDRVYTINGVAKTVNPVYIDGVRYLCNQGDSNGIIEYNSGGYYGINVSNVCDYGYHLVSIWLNTRTTNTSNQIGVPKEALCVMTPNYVGDTGNMVIRDKFENGNGSFGITEYATVVLMCNSQDAFYIRLKQYKEPGEPSRGRIVQVFVPTGTKTSFINFNDSSSMHFHWHQMGELMTERDFEI